MSFDIIVLCSTPLPPKSEWQMMMVQQHFPITIGSSFNPAKDTGFWPVEIRGKPTGFEFYLLGRSEWEHLPNVSGHRSWVSGAQFTTGSDITAFAVSIMTAVALARRCGGILYDPQASKPYDGGETSKFLAQTLSFAGLPAQEP